MPFNAPGEYTLSVTSSENQFAAPSDTDAVISVVLDCSTMAIGDAITFKLHSKTFAGDASPRVLWSETVQGPMATDVMLGNGMQFDVRTGWKLTAQKVTGTDRSIRAAVLGVS